jgi:HSP20 family protein
MRHLSKCTVPSRNVFSFGRDLERFFDRFENSSEELSSFTPAVDIVENEDSLLLTVEIPGVNKEDVKLSVENNVLTISGEKKNNVEVKEDDFRRIERSYGSFSRSFNLSSRIDNEKIEARFENGILAVNLPKKEESKPRQIEVKVK